MSSDWFSDPRWGEICRDNIEKYGTNDYETISMMKAYAKKEVEAKADKMANSKIVEMLPEIKSTEHAEALKQVRAEYALADGRRIFGISPFCSETITVADEELKRSHFFPDRQVYDPIREDVRLYFDDLSD